MKRPLLLALALAPLGLAPCALHAAPVKAKTLSKTNAKTPIEARVDALWEQSDAAFHKGDYPAAIALHRQIVKLAPDDVESYSVGAWLLWSLGKTADSNAFIAQGLKANPKSAEMWDAAGGHYNFQHAFPLAKQAFVQAVRFSGPKAPEMLRRRLAHAAEGAGDFALATKTWTQLVRDFPNSPVNKNNLARVLETQKKKNRMPDGIAT